MNEQLKDRSETGNTNYRLGLEMLLFLVVSAIGIYGLGQGLTGLFEPGQGIHLIWLAVTGIVFMILFAQLGRRRCGQPNWSHSHHQPVLFHPGVCIGGFCPALTTSRCSAKHRSLLAILSTGPACLECSGSANRVNLRRYVAARPLWRGLLRTGDLCLPH